MRLFICEFITGGGLFDQELPDNLVREGSMILEAVLKDLLELGITDINTTRDTRLDPLLLPVEIVAYEEDIYPVWESCMNDADATLIVAPESNDILFNLTVMAEQTDCYVLGCTSRSVKSASSKLQTAHLLSKNNISCIETRLLKDNINPETDSSWVIKPDDGVGAEDCYFCTDIKDLERLKKVVGIENFVIQKYLAGVPASLSMLCYQGKAQLLACNKQIFNFEHGKGVFKGLVINGLSEQWTQFDTIAQNIAKADTGLLGYVGVDLILTESGPCVVEINPRLTTSYVGLSASLSLNPAELILSIWQNGSMPEFHNNQFLPVNIMLEKDNVV